MKEIVDATKCFPFSNEGIEELALDPQIRSAAYQIARGSQHQARTVERAYLGSKRRTHEALRASRSKSFGVREEYRITWGLFIALQDRLRFVDVPESDGALGDCPRHVWAIQTRHYLDFLRRSADKFATGFEIVFATCARDLITWEQTKIMAMFLRCLRYVFGGHLLSVESALWWSRRDRKRPGAGLQRSWYGMGFCNTLPAYKYCWLEPRVDWERLQFMSDISESMLFGNRMLQQRYRHRARVQAFFDLTRRLDLALDWLRRFQGIREVRKRLVSWIVHICHQQFRKDVLQCVKSELIEEGRAEVLEGWEPFCYE